MLISEIVLSHQVALFGAVFTSFAQAGTQATLCDLSLGVWSPVRILDYLVDPVSQGLKSGCIPLLFDLIIATSLPSPVSSIFNSNYFARAFQFSPGTS